MVIISLDFSFFGQLFLWIIIFLYHLSYFTTDIMRWRCRLLHRRGRGDGSGFTERFDYFTFQTLRTMPWNCWENSGAQTNNALFSHPYLLSAGASNWGAALK